MPASPGFHFSQLKIKYLLIKCGNVAISKDGRFSNRPYGFVIFEISAGLFECLFFAVRTHIITSAITSRCS